MPLTSVGRRQFWNYSFLFVCVVTATASVAILGVLISSIVISAIPVFGPYEDKLESEGRIVLVQGSNPGNDPAAIDAGDLLQGIAVASKLDRGGLGSDNDEPFRGFDSEMPKGPATVTLLSYEIKSQIEDNVFELVPATGDNNVTAWIKTIGASTGLNLDQSSAAMAILENPSTDIDFSKLEIEGSLTPNSQLAGAIGGANWSATMLIGPRQDHDFAELMAGTTEVSKLKKTRSRKEFGRLKVLNSVLAHNLDPSTEFYPIKLRAYSADEVIRSDVKIDGNKLVGLSRSKKRGFDLGGSFRTGLLPHTRSGCVRHQAFCPLHARDAQDAGGRSGNWPGTDGITVGHHGLCPVRIAAGHCHGGSTWKSSNRPIVFCCSGTS